MAIRRRAEIYRAVVFAKWGLRYRHRSAARIEHLEPSVGRYLFELGRADRDPTRVTEVRIAHINHKIRSIRARIKELSAIGEQIRSARYKLREQIAEKMFRDNRTVTISEVVEQTGIARGAVEPREQARLQHAH